MKPKLTTAKRVALLMIAERPRGTTKRTIEPYIGGRVASCLIRDGLATRKPDSWGVGYEIHITAAGRALLALVGLVLMLAGCGDNLDPVPLPWCGDVDGCVIPYCVDPNDEACKCWPDVKSDHFVVCYCALPNSPWCEP